MPKRNFSEENGTAYEEDAAFEIWELGNIARRWADMPGSITKVDMEDFLERCHKAKLEGIRLLYRFQQYRHQQTAYSLPELAAPAIAEGSPQS